MLTGADMPSAPIGQRTDTKTHIRENLPDGPFALALSGGGDSLALLNCLRDHPNLDGALIVDHGLRDGSAREARKVQSVTESLGVKADVLTWSPPDTLRSGVQAKARKARYGLLGQACRERGLKYLLTAHHSDDQAETVLMRLGRGSGWRGAAGMKMRTYGPIWPELAGVTLIRPALGLSRNVLRAELGALTPIEDPSNANRRFTRIRVRERLKLNKALKDEMLALSADMRKGREVERRLIARDLSDATLFENGRMRLPHIPRLETLAVLAPMIGGQSGPVKRNRLAKAVQTLNSGRSVNLGSGCLAQWKNERLSLMREPAAMLGRRDGRLAPTAIPASITRVPRIWDGRFLVSGQGGVILPIRDGHHIGYAVEDGQDVRVQSLIQARLEAFLTEA